MYRCSFQRFFFFFFFFFFLYIHTSNLQKRKRLYKTQYPTIEHPNGGVLHTKILKTQKNISRTDRKKRIKWQRRHEKDVYMSGVLNLSDDLRNIIVFLSIEAFVSTLYPSSPYKSNLINLSSERFAIEPIISVILSVSNFRICV